MTANESKQTDCSWCDGKGRMQVSAGVGTQTVDCPHCEEEREANESKQAGAVPYALLDRVKLERECPRCRAQRYHFATRRLVGRAGSDTLAGRHLVEIACAECGHLWQGRFTREEWT